MEIENIAEIELEGLNGFGDGKDGKSAYETICTFNDAYSNWCSGEKFPIVICGDSTIAGYGTSDISGRTKAWVKRLEEKLRYDFNNDIVAIYNAGATGTSLPSADQFDTWFGDGGVYKNYKMVGIGWGINDRVSLTDKKTYYNNVFSKVEALILKAFDYGIQPFLLTTQATMESNPTDEYSTSSPMRNSENINTCANSAKRDLARKYNLEIIDLNELTEIYLKNSSVDINTIIPDKLHFADLGHLFEAGAIFANMVNRTITVEQKNQLILNYADQHITHSVQEDKLSYGGTTKVYTSYTKDSIDDIKIFDAYVYIKNLPSTIEAYKTNINSSTYVVLDGEVPENKQIIKLSLVSNKLPNLDIGLHHLEVYTGENSLVDFAGFIINKINYSNEPEEVVLFDNTDTYSLNDTLPFIPAAAPGALYFDYDVANQKTLLSGKTLTSIEMYLTLPPKATEGTITIGKIDATGSVSAANATYIKTITVSANDIKNNVATINLDNLKLGEHETLTVQKSDDTAKAKYLDKNAINPCKPHSTLVSNNNTYDVSPIGFRCKIKGFN